MDELFRGECQTLGPEQFEGNVEYKLKLVDPSPDRFDRLVTQLKYRLTEGDGEALYEIGVGDDGTPYGLEEGPLTASTLTLLRTMTPVMGRPPTAPANALPTPWASISRS